MSVKNYHYLFIIALLTASGAAAQNALFPIITKAGRVTIVYDNKAPKLDSISAGLLAEDIERVTSFKPHVVTDITKAKGNIIVIGSIQLPLVKKILGVRAAFSQNLTGKWECF